MQLGFRRNILFLVFVITSLLAGAQPVKSHRYSFGRIQEPARIITDGFNIRISHRLPGLTIRSIGHEEGDFYRIEAEGYSRSSETGKPELPVMSRLITIPGDSEPEIKISNVRTEIIRPSADNLKGLLYPAQESETKTAGSQRKLIIDSRVYSARGFLPSDTVRIEKTGTIRGKKIANLIISPVLYDPSSNRLEIITSMDIEISFKGDTGLLPENEAEESLLFAGTLTKGVLNYAPGDLITGYSDEPVRMIIVTDTIFRKQLEPFLKWKAIKGFRVDVLYKGRDFAPANYIPLKDTLQKLYDHYSATSVAPEYLLIVGDVSKIPYYGTGYVSDTYYGEFDGNGDYIPDMFIGRLPVRDTAQLSGVLRKIIEYEKFEFDGSNDFYKRALATTGKDENYADHMNGQVKYAVENYLNAGNGIYGYHFYYPESYTNKDSIIALINKGLSFINYSGHGVASGWQHVEIKTPDIAGLTNRSMYPFIISNACRTAQYDDTLSFGNKMVVSRDKGAIGFIGCSNDSYWDEDFYWAVGAGTPSADPGFLTTGPGAYDRLFHTHGESPSEWYFTMGQVNFAGNLSVSSSTSSRKKYYWETYSLLGDPSLIPVMGQPSSFSVSLPDTIPNGITNLSLITEPFAYVAISHSDTLWDASFASPAGSVSLDIPSISDDSCLVVITGQNMIPLFKTIYISPVDKEYINYTFSGINDPLGNDNGLADFGETFYADLKLGNYGGSDAYDISAVISSDSEWITILSDSVYIGTLSAGSEIILDNDFEMRLSEDVPDQGLFSVNLYVKGPNTNKHFILTVEVHSAVLEILSCTIDDTADGNGNFIADPGEMFNLIFRIINRGTSSTEGDLDISGFSDNLAIPDPSVKSGILESGSSSEIKVTVILSESASTGDFFNIASVLTCPPDNVSRDFTFRAGRIRESFESGTFLVFPWINSGNKPWITNDDYAIDGNMSARSGMISHNEKSNLTIRSIYEKADSLRFWYKVSSEQSYDYFSFTLNDKELLRKSGETGWVRVSVPVPAGINRMEWNYRKDNSVSHGSDAAWIDLIDFSDSAPVRYISKDLEVSEILSPVVKDSYGRELVTVKVRNTGSTIINGFYLAFRTNDNSLTEKEFFNIMLKPVNDSAVVTFTGRADMSRFGTYDFRVYSLDNNDEFTANDTINALFDNKVLKESVVVYPNPFTGTLTVEIASPLSGEVKLTVIGASGQKIYESDHIIEEGETLILIDDLIAPPSVMYLSIKGAGLNNTIPIVKIR